MDNNTKKRIRKNNNNNLANKDKIIVRQHVILQKKGTWNKCKPYYLSN